MAPERRHAPLQEVKLEGRNHGATMANRRVCAGESHDCCTVNIYVSNNIQGVNNSIMFGSEVRMGDPGVSLVLKDLGFDTEHQKSIKKSFCGSLITYSLALAFLFAMFFLLLLLFLAP
ncbi:hypothetical protein LIER_38953 [Lithospermum erythrorhizon]|uniref:Uncharacterized protein n=1 Tax=Lithospermum erythrorhizon TaxID=34254 RepID=A0AAV3Q7E0_LITER